MGGFRQRNARRAEEAVSGRGEAGERRSPQPGHSSRKRPGPLPRGWSGFRGASSGWARRTSADAKPVHRVRLDGFWMDRTEVTNEQFERFVRATGYVTVAERKPDAKDYPGAPPEMLVPGSIVFTPPQ